MGTLVQRFVHENSDTGPKEKHLKITEQRSHWMRKASTKLAGLRDLKC